MKNIFLSSVLIAIAIATFGQSASAMTIYVGNLNWNVRDQDLYDMFAPFGTVTSAKIVTDKEKGNRSKGYGFVVMPDDNEARAAINALHQSAQVDNGRPMIVTEVRSGGTGSTKPFGSGGGGGFQKPNNGSPKPTTTPTQPAEPVLDQSAAEDLITEATNWLSNLTDDGDIITAITEKWDAIEDITGKTRTQLLNLLLDDAKSVITDKTTRDAFVKGWNDNTKPAKP